MSSFIFLDVETTGIDPSLNRIIEVAAIKWENFRITDRYESLVQPRTSIPQEVVMLTGITNEMVKGAPLFGDIVEKLQRFIGDLPVVGHNIAFDMAFLKTHHLHLKNPQIDTVSLARILLLKESSYALEVLMKKYGLPLRGSHRAMSDVETTASFFEFLLGRISELPEEVLAEFQEVLKKSDWAGKAIFNESAAAAGTTHFLGTGGSAAPAAADRLVSRPRHPAFGGDQAGGASDTCLKNASVPAAAASKQLFEKCSIATPAPYTDFLNGQKILLESSQEIPLELFKENPVIIAYATDRKRNELLEEIKAHSLRLSAFGPLRLRQMRSCVLKEPQFYLSTKRLREKLAQANIPAEETPFLLKILHWQNCTQTGDREEISLDREEYGQFDALADDGTGKFFTATLSEAQKSEILLIHHHAIASTFITSSLYHSITSLLIAEAAKLEDSLTQALKQRFTESRLRPYFDEKAALLFGLLGIFFEKFSEVDAGGFRGHVILDDANRASIEWKRFLAACENLPDHPKKSEFLKTLESRENFVAWVSSWQNEVSFTAAPILLANIFQKAAAPFKNIMLQSEALSGDGSFHLVKKLFELDSSWLSMSFPQKRESKDAISTIDPRLREDDNINIIIPENFPEPYSTGYFKRCEKLFLELIKEHKGKCLFLMSSKKATLAMYQSLLPKMPEETRLLAVGPTGGTGKTVALFLENPAKSALIVTNQILPFLPEIEQHIETIIFQKIPFDPPDDPVLMLRGKQFDNSFKHYTLPRAVMRFRELLAELGKSAKNAEHKLKTCHLLDSRLRSREYGRLFI